MNVSKKDFELVFGNAVRKYAMLFFFFFGLLVVSNQFMVDSFLHGRAANTFIAQMLFLFAVIGSAVLLFFILPFRVIPCVIRKLKLQKKIFTKNIRFDYYIPAKKISGNSVFFVDMAKSIVYINEFEFNTIDFRAINIVKKGRKTWLCFKFESDSCPVFRLPMVSMDVAEDEEQRFLNWVNKHRS